MVSVTREGIMEGVQGGGVNTLKFKASQGNLVNSVSR